MKQRAIETESQLVQVVKVLEGLKRPFTLSWREGKVRTLTQNGLIHMWYGEIAKHFGDRDMLNVKGQCHVEYGVPIRLRHTLFAYVWENLFQDLTYEKQCAFFEKQYRKVNDEKGEPVLYMTSIMTTKELSEYMTPMYRDYTEQGVHLTNPEDLKWQ